MMSQIESLFRILDTGKLNVKKLDRAQKFYKAVTGEEVSNPASFSFELLIGGV